MAVLVRRHANIIRKPPRGPLAAQQLTRAGDQGGGASGRSSQGTQPLRRGTREEDHAGRVKPNRDRGAAVFPGRYRRGGPLALQYSLRTKL